MRFFIGVLVGIVLVIGAAYIHDGSIDPAREDGGKPLVHWDVATQDLRGINEWLQSEWAWLNEKFHKPA